MYNLLLLLAIIVYAQLIFTTVYAQPSIPTTAIPTTAIPTTAIPTTTIPTTAIPTTVPTSIPTTTHAPTLKPSASPSTSGPSAAPTVYPTAKQTANPTTSTLNCGQCNSIQNGVCQFTNSVNFINCNPNNNNNPNQYTTCVYSGGIYSSISISSGVHITAESSCELTFNNISMFSMMKRAKLSAFAVNITSPSIYIQGEISTLSFYNFQSEGDAKNATYGGSYGGSGGRQLCDNTYFSNTNFNQIGHFVVPQDYNQTGYNSSFGAKGCCGHKSGVGGGRIVLSSSKLVNISGGILRADGNVSTDSKAGSGSGGSVTIIANSLVGEGFISVVGGNAYGVIPKSNNRRFLTYSFEGPLLLPIKMNRVVGGTKNPTPIPTHAPTMPAPTAKPRPTLQPTFSPTITARGAGGGGGRIYLNVKNTLNDISYDKWKFHGGYANSNNCLRGSPGSLYITNGVSGTVIFNNTFSPSFATSNIDVLPLTNLNVNNYYSNIFVNEGMKANTFTLNTNSLLITGEVVMFTIAETFYVDLTSRIYYNQNLSISTTLDNLEIDGQIFSSSRSFSSLLLRSDKNISMSSSLNLFKNNNLVYMNASGLIFNSKSAILMNSSKCLTNSSTIDPTLIMKNQCLLNNEIDFPKPGSYHANALILSATSIIINDNSQFQASIILACSRNIEVGKNVVISAVGLGCAKQVSVSAATSSESGDPPNFILLPGSSSENGGTGGGIVAFMASEGLNFASNSIFNVSGKKGGFGGSILLSSNLLNLDTNTYLDGANGNVSIFYQQNNIITYIPYPQNCDDSNNDFPCEINKFIVLSNITTSAPHGKIAWPWCPVGYGGLHDKYKSYTSGGLVCKICETDSGDGYYNIVDDDDSGCNKCSDSKSTMIPENSFYTPYDSNEVNKGSIICTVDYSHYTTQDFNFQTCCYKCKPGYRTSITS